MTHLLLAAGIALIVIGVLLRYWRGRRKFYRRNAAGIEEFSNYHRSVLVRGWETLIGWLSVMSIVAGLLLLSAVSCKHRWLDRARHPQVSVPTTLCKPVNPSTFNRHDRPYHV